MERLALFILIALLVLIALAIGGLYLVYRLDTSSEDIEIWREPK